MHVLNAFSTFVLYFIVFVATVFLAIATKHSRRLILRTFVVMMPCFLVLRFRYGIGSDFYNYDSFYDLVLKEAAWVNLEIGFKYIVLLSERLYGNYNGFTYITSTITCICFFSFFLYKSGRRNNGLFVFVALCLYFSMWYNIIRQVVAIGLIFWSFEMIEKNKLKVFILLVLLAFLFHKSALVVFPCYFLIPHKEGSNSNVSSKRVILLLIASLLLIIALPYLDISGLKYSNYIGDDSENGRTYMMILLGLMIYPIELLYMKRLIATDKRNILYFYFFVIEFTTFALSTQIAFAFRMGQYFSIAHPIILCKILDYNHVRGHNRKYKIKEKAIKAYTVAVFSFYFIFTVFSLGHNGISNYMYLLP